MIQPRATPWEERQKTMPALKERNSRFRAEKKNSLFEKMRLRPFRGGAALGFIIYGPSGLRARSTEEAKLHGAIQEIEVIQNSMGTGV